MTKKGGKIKHIEPQGADLVDANLNVQRFFVHAGWYPLCSILGSSHLSVANEFSLSLNGQEENIYGLRLQVSVESIVEAFNLPQEGEQWFKGQVIIGGDLNGFIKD